MLEYNGKELRNLQEQVLKNAQDIEDFKAAKSVLEEFGIKVLGQYDSILELYDAHPEETYEGDFGDAFAVGTGVPYDYYIYTRGQEHGFWFLIGTFPQPGPQGEEGPRGERGLQGEPGAALKSGFTSPTGTDVNGQLYVNLTSGTLYRFNQGIWTTVGSIIGPRGYQGPQGERGPQGAQGTPGTPGPRGDVGGFINIRGKLNSTNELPNPSTISDRTWAFLVGNQNNLYVQIPTTPTSSTYLWQNFGQLNLGTYVTESGEFVNIWDADSKLDISEVSEEKTPYTVIRRDAQGRAQVNEPIYNDDIATKKYVDDHAGGGGEGNILYRHNIYIQSIEYPDYYVSCDNIYIEIINNRSEAYAVDNGDYLGALTDALSADFPNAMIPVIYGTITLTNPDYIKALHFMDDTHVTVYYHESTSGVTFEWTVSGFSDTVVQI